LTERNIDDLFIILQKIHCQDNIILIQNENIHNNYFKKMKERFNEIDYFFDDAEEVFEKIIMDLSQNYAPEIVGMIHGDFWFSNIILDYQDKYRLIDMRGQIDGILTMNGDKYYDYGKMYQSILGYDLVLNGAQMNLDYLERMKEIFLRKCKDFGVNIEYLKAVTRGLIFGTIHFIEKKETKERVWEFIKSI
jgi:tRNA A-37 threonylcarbamoyl transferase component Bud32